MDDRGFCRVVGRSKDVIIRGGENIYPAEIEEVLFAHDAVANVSVVGVPDWEYGEVICAWVSLRDGAAVDKMDDVLREHVRANLAHFKIPAYFVFRHDFPTTITGKIQKFKSTSTAPPIVHSFPLSSSFLITVVIVVVVREIAIAELGLSMDPPPQVSNL
ncbi:hypothetical protein AaE_015625 [Aphanomyces astaci]|nr:hypothetical protein AaE_015625 [Aphanomyces astaci]